MEPGLSSHHAEQQLEKFGKNEIALQTSFSISKAILSQLLTVINGILAFAALFSFYIDNKLDGIFILAVIILNTALSFIQEYKAEKALEKLKHYTTPVCTVIRDGKATQIPTSHLVPEDVVVLSEGDRIPADGIVLHANALEIDEAILTGESLPALKNVKEEVFAGTLIVKGKGYYKVTQTGMHTKLGQITQTLSTIETEETPLQKDLSRIGKLLSLGVVVLILILIAIGSVQQREFVPMLLTAISIGVAAIPEGLPAIITISLAIGVSHMAKRNAIVRKMQAVETLGSVQIILTDKTGTLTQNTMKVKKVWTAAGKVDQHFLLACILGNTSTIIQKADAKFDVIGDQTDAALRVWAQEQDKTIEDMVKQGTITDEFVFDNETKTITTIWEEKGKKHIFTRGAPEIILAKSVGTEKEKQHIQKEIDTYAKEGFRVIAFATKLSHHEQSPKREDVESKLHFLGLVAMYDPPREEAKQAIEEAKRAGIRVIMVTGDNPLTALSISKDIGLIEKDEEVITGAELEKISDQELEQVIAKTRVFARTRPEDKFRIVSALKSLGYVVGVTGDGVNDSLALKKADVGVAMGKSGTDVAKEASDIVLADDNFATLVKAVEEGRTIYKNISKAVIYLLSGNLSELFLIFFSVVTGMPLPLLPTHILWINLVTDVLPAIGLANDTKDPFILAEKPRNSHMGLLNKKRGFFIFAVGTFLAEILFIIFVILQNYLLLPLQQSQTIIFNVLIISHLMLALLLRKQSIFRVNKFLYVSIGIIIALQIIITTTPALQEIFHLAR